MSTSFSRRRLLQLVTGAGAWFASRSATRAAKPAVKHALASAHAPSDYEPTRHSWLVCIDLDRCIGCGTCVDACKRENRVPDAPVYFRTWVERYVIRKAPRGSSEPRGEVTVDSPDGARNGFPNPTVPRSEILKAFFVPKLCNHCEHSPCVQACPVGATFETPDGVVLIDPNYCIGCGFCVQACPYGCRFLSPVTRTAEKCTLCYHRTTRGLKPACVEVCPTHARIFGDLKNPVDDDPVQAFIQEKKIGVLKQYLGTDPRLCYAGLDKEVR